MIEGDNNPVICTELIEGLCMGIKLDKEYTIKGAKNVTFDMVMVVVVEY